jgi:hypothetical protein
MNKKTLGRILIILGVLMWVPYGILKYALGQDVPVLPFLILHLSGVIPGAILAPSSTIWERARRLFNRTTDSSTKQD